MSNNIELSIWGIRGGFEENGMFHTHSMLDVKNEQTDRFRDLANLIRTNDAYLIQKTGNHTIVSLIYTNIRESVGARRGGYVVFSLIIPRGFCFVNSPLRNLKELADFYSKRVGDGSVNNFTEGQIRQMIEDLKIQPLRLNERSQRLYTVISNENDLQSYLKCDSAACAVKELLFIPKDFQPSELGLDASFQKIDLKQKEEEILLEELEKKKRYQEEEDKRNRIKQKEKDIINLLQAEQEDQAIKIYHSSEFKGKFSLLLKEKIESTEKTIEKKAELKRKEARDAEILQTISSCIRNNELKKASDYAQTLTTIIGLSESDQKLINDYRKVENKRIKDLRQETEERDRIKKRNKTKRITILSSVIVVLLGFFILSYSLSIPVSWYDKDADGIVNSIDECPDETGVEACNGCPDKDNDGIADKIDDCPGSKGEEKCSGCPADDCDNDGIIGDKDECPNESGTKDCNGCPDTDKDGIADKDDKCPDVKGNKEGLGCPQKVKVLSPKDLKLKDDIAKLKEGKAIQLKDMGRNNILNSKWVKIQNEQWQYSDKEKGTFSEVKTDRSYELLNNLFEFELKKKTETKIANSQNGQLHVPQVNDTTDPIEVPEDHIKKMKQMYDSAKFKVNISSNEKKDWDELVQIYEGNVKAKTWETNSKITSWNKLFQKIDVKD